LRTVAAARARTGGGCVTGATDEPAASGGAASTDRGHPVPNARAEYGGWNGLAKGAGRAEASRGAGRAARPAPRDASARPAPFASPFQPPYSALAFGTGCPRSVLAAPPLAAGSSVAPVTQPPPVRARAAATVLN